jgi:hypothetical protein
MTPNTAVKLTFSLVLFLVGAGSTAHAQTTPVATRQGTSSVVERPGFDFGLRLGYAVPFGDMVQNTGLNDNFSSAIPFVLEAGYRFTRNISAGALFQYGFTQIKDNQVTGCGNGVSCSGSVIRLGVEGIYNFRLGTTLDPWVGLGVGYEWMNIDLVNNNGVSTSAGMSGVEFLTVQGGADHRLTPQLALGPFLSFSIARYGTFSNEARGITRSGDITDTAVHEWLQLGIRGTFSI